MRGARRYHPSQRRAESGRRSGFLPPLSDVLNFLLSQYVRARLECEFRIGMVSDRVQGHLGSCCLPPEKGRDFELIVIVQIVHRGLPSMRVQRRVGGPFGIVGNR